ncbi:type III sulfide quinone reductase, selenoprotein subtype [Nocardioides pakistanensis]
MKDLLILGAGTAGTMIANKLHRKLPKGEWRITIVDRDDRHNYQPGYLFLPFGTYSEKQIVRSRRSFLPKGVDFVMAEVDKIDPDASSVALMDGRTLKYDYLVIASGTTPRPDQTLGMADGPEWRKSIFDFYTLEGAKALADALQKFDHGRLVVHVTEMPIKCPVAPLEFVFLAEAWLNERGIRDRVELTYVTPLPGAFTKPAASQHLGSMIDERKIHLETDFMIESIDNEKKALVSFDEREVPFDLLVTIPLNMGADFVARSGMGDDLNYVPVDKHTMQSKKYPNVFTVGDAGDIPASKAGSVAHFAVEIFVDNFLELIEGRPMTESFDGHANCFIESGYKKGLLIDFNYDTEPLPGKFPVPKIGPLDLLKESRANHIGKLAFRHIYWNVLLPGRSMPISTHMSMAGKIPLATTTENQE